MTARIAVCCGVGGTGKTTTSAGLGVSYAMQGERVVVLTIDPARRLADALSIGTLSNEPTPVPLPKAKGSLHALMLDRKGTWDQVITRHADPKTAERLLKNRYYRAVSTRLSGSHEYMAVEKMHELAIEGGFDRVIVDTPPTQHVIDFFRAPDRVQGILDRSMLSLLLDPSGISGFATRGALSVVGRLAGDRVISEIREFFTLIGSMSQGFRERSEAVAALLSDPSTSYWLIADANAPERNDLLGFLAELRGRGMSFAGFLVNRVLPVPKGEIPSREELLARGSGEPGWEAAVDALLALPGSVGALAEAQRSAIRELQAGAGGAPCWLIPEISGGVRSLSGLLEIAEHLPPHPAV